MTISTTNRWLPGAPAALMMPVTGANCCATLKMMEFTPNVMDVALKIADFSRIER